MSNRDRVGRAFEALAAGLAPYVDRRMRGAGHPDWASEVPSGPSEREMQGPTPLRGGQPARDPAFLLKLMVDSWDRAFAAELGRSERNVVFELRDWRTAGPTTTASPPTTPTAPSTPSSGCWRQPTPGKLSRSVPPRVS